MLSLEELFQVVIVAFCAGMGSSVGNYLIQRTLIRHFEKVGKKNEEGNVQRIQETSK